VSLDFFAFMGLLGDDPTLGILLALGVLCVAGVLVDRWVPPA
jgi:hypothetical protein